MAGFASDLRGLGLVQTLRALEDLDRNPPLLDRARRQYDISPPPYRSSLSGTPTRSASPVTASEQQKRSEQRRWQLMEERSASSPYYQFKAQHEEERRRLCWDADPMIGEMCLSTPIAGFEKEAYEIVKNRWIEQGIWKTEWDGQYRPHTC
jgi:hypothetical protein